MSDPYLALAKQAGRENKGIRESQTIAQKTMELVIRTGGMIMRIGRS